MMKLNHESERSAPTPKGETRRNRLLEVATEEFLTVGYAQTSMKTIIQKAGGSAATAYQLFSNKEGLLEAVLTHEFDSLEAQFFPASLLSKPPKSALPAIALGLLSYMVKPKAVDFYRILMSEGHRIPGIAEQFRHLLALQVTDPLERYLRNASDRGELQIVDPANGAKILGHLLQGIATEARIVGGYTEGLPPAEKSICTYSVEVMLSLWSPK